MKHIEIDQVFAYLKKKRLISAVEITFCDTTQQRSVYRLRCRLTPATYQLFIRIIQTPTELVYSYQLFTDHPIVRWDNAPHFPNIPAFPHHFHDQSDTVHSSPLQGDIFADLEIVLSDVLDMVQKQDGI